MTTDNEQTQSRAEFYLCLARAFMTPSDDAAWAGLREALADDLEELGRELGYPIAAHIDAYRSAIAAIPDRDALLQIYSSLFLAPPYRVSINAGSYIDGALNGGSVAAMEEAYRRGGYARRTDFRDLSDHVAAQLEFVARRLFARLHADEMAEEGATKMRAGDAENFLHDFVARWLPGFIADLERQDAETNPYLHLARALREAVALDARAEDSPAATRRRLAALDKARHERAEQGIRQEDLDFIAQRLSERGLDTAHLAVPLDQRDEAQGWSRKVPPSPRRGSRLG